MAFTKPCFADVILTYPAPDAIVSDDHITFKWENTDPSKEYEYQLMLSPYDIDINHWFSSTVYVTKETSYELNNIQGKFNWYVQYTEKDTFPRNLYSTKIQSFTFNKISKDIPIPEVKPVIKKAIVKENNEESMDWEVKSSDTPDVWGITDENVCKYIYFKNRNVSEVDKCILPTIQVTKSESYIFEGLIYTHLQVSVPQRVNMSIEVYECKRQLKDLASWFECNVELKEVKTSVLFPNFSFDLDEGIQQVVSNDGYLDIYSKGYSQKSSILLQYAGSASLPNFNISLQLGGSVKVPIQVIDASKNKKLGFPFENIVGVTQWHGFTEYESPHSGIDFGVREQNVLAVGNGEVVAKGWDNYKGECFSGGNYLVIKQANGLYTVYFHLKEASVNVGKHLKVGEVIGISGNTGAWNCQPLGYHLHFEVRLQRAQSSHVNPVDYIQVDWNSVFTLGSKSFPGRLSGDNPHPNF